MNAGELLTNAFDLEKYSSSQVVTAGQIQFVQSQGKGALTLEDTEVLLPLDGLARKKLCKFFGVPSVFFDKVSKENHAEVFSVLMKSLPESLEIGVSFRDARLVYFVRSDDMFLTPYQVAFAAVAEEDKSLLVPRACVNEEQTFFQIVYPSRGRFKPSVAVLADWGASYTKMAPLVFQMLYNEPVGASLVVGESEVICPKGKTPGELALTLTEKIKQTKVKAVKSQNVLTHIATLTVDEYRSDFIDRHLSSVPKFAASVKAMRDNNPGFTVGQVVEDSLKSLSSVSNLKSQLRYGKFVGSMVFTSKGR